MPVPLAALFAAAIYQQRSALVDPEDIERSLSLLCRASGTTAATFEVRGDDLLINGMPLSLEAPGATVIRHALVDHHTTRLDLPRALSGTQWGEVVALYASAPGLYPTVDDLRDALRFSIPDAVVYGTSGPSAEGDLRQSLFELPGLRGVASARDVTRAAEAREAAIAELNEQLDPLLRAITEAKTKLDYPKVALLLSRMHDLAQTRDREQRDIVARERRRTVPSDVLEAMARLIPKSTESRSIARVLSAMGNDGAAALLNALSSANTHHERRAYIDALVACHDCDAAIIDVLGHQDPDMIRDAAEIIGRKRLTQAVPILARLLKHSKVDVRTTAWHALELIGTREAVTVLRA